MLTQWQNLVVCKSLPGDAPAMTWLGNHMICQTKKRAQNKIKLIGHISKTEKQIKDRPQWSWDTRLSVIQ